MAVSLMTSRRSLPVGLGQLEQQGRIDQQRRLGRIRPGTGAWEQLNGQVWRLVLKTAVFPAPYRVDEVAVRTQAGAIAKPQQVSADINALAASQAGGGAAMPMAHPGRLTIQCTGCILRS